jgi:hypothetical protein
VDDWRIIRSTDTIETFPEGTQSFVLEALTDGLEWEWRSIIARLDPFEVDHDVEGAEVMIAFSEPGESYALARMNLDDGSMGSQVAMEKAYPRIASIGSGSVALLRSQPCSVDGLACVTLSIIDAGGSESERVPVSDLGTVGGCYNVPYDVVWTGSEIGVILALGVEAGGCRYYLKRFSP